MSTRTVSAATYPRVAWPTLARTAGRYPEGDFYEDLARLASRGRMGAEDLLAYARAGKRPRRAQFDSRGLAWFGHVTASRIQAPTRAEDATQVFALAHRIGGRRTFARQLDFVWVQAAYLAGCLDQYAPTLRTSTAPPDVWWAATTDGLHPEHLDSSSEEWLESFNQPLLAAGLEPLTFGNTGNSPFDRVVAPISPVASPVISPVISPAAGGSDPLVSVVIPVYNPGQGLRTAVRSLLAQTWGNLEILLCDDASTQGHEIIEELEQLDARVRITRAPRNGGAYSVRNLGIGHASGEFVTFNDSDDWSHPRRVERQVRALQENGAARAVVSGCIRVTQDLRLTVMGRPPRRVNLSSILFRRSDVVRDLGGFDGVRRGADSEFVSRFKAFYGPEALLELTEPLALVQLTSGSLSRDDYRFLHTHPARLQYSADFQHWHASLVAHPDAAYVAPGARAPFPAPAHISGQTPETAHVDTLILANLGETARTVVDLASDVEALSGSGMSVALSEYLAPFDVAERVQLPSGRLAELIRTGRALRVLPGDPVCANVVLLRDPAAVATMPAGILDAVTAPVVLVSADYGPAHGTNYDAAEVHQRLADRLGAEIRWIPATAAIGAELRQQVDPETVMEPVLFASIPKVDAPPRPWPEQPRVGLWLGSTHRVPARELTRMVRRLSPARRRAQRVTWGPRKQFATVVPSGMTHLDSNEVDVPGFVSQIDVLVVAAAQGRGPHLDPVAVAALAHGCIVVLDPGYREHFGDAAFYLDQGTVDHVLKSLLSSPELVTAQQERARHYVATRLSPGALVNTLTRVQDHARKEGPAG